MKYKHGARGLEQVEWSTVDKIMTAETVRLELKKMSRKGILQSDIGYRLSHDKNLQLRAHTATHLNCKCRFLRHLCVSKDCFCSFCVNCRKVAAARAGSAEVHRSFGV